MPIIWNGGMMEYWNNVLKTYNLRVEIKVSGSNFHYLPMNIFIVSIWFESYLSIVPSFQL